MKHKILEEFDGIKVHSFRRADGAFIGQPNMYFKVEPKNGEMAIVNRYFVIRLDTNDREVERWNLDHLACVYWAEEYMPFMKIENDLADDDVPF